MDPELGPNSIELPKISDETRQKLFEELNLDVDPKTRQITESISGKHPPSFSEAETQLTENVFSDILGVNRAFVETINRGLLSKKKIAGTLEKDSVLKGMAIVFRAYHMESDFSLLNNLQKLSSEDLAKVSQAIEDTVSDPSIQKSVLERLLELKRIPELEVNLNQIVDTASRPSGYSRAVKEGGAAMYYVLSALKGKLFIKASSNSPNP